ncbi:MAG TPA: cytochrome c oxidase assembly protein [Vicinamibacterales bacterium]|nr:cytochrome c oxidase assembly protein [Vicinamibacterales bacterium]
MRVGDRVARTRRALVTAAAVVSPAVLYAHGLEEELNEPRALSPWDILALAVLVGMATLYVRGSVHLRNRGAVHPLRERVAFALGWLALVVSILPPLDALALQLFSAHMAQHELMMLVGAPLLIAGRPLAPCLWGLGERSRHRAGRVLQGDAVNGLWRLFTLPVVAWVLHGAVIWVWHLPGLYEWAIHNESVHAAQHAMFIGTSALFWWGLIYGRYGRAGYGAAVFYVFTTAVHTGILGALLTFAGTPLYPSYVATAAARGGDPLADQQVAGLVMWIPAGIVLTLMGLALFMAWLGESERRASRHTQRRTAEFRSRLTLVALMAVVGTLTTGCGARDSDERIARELTGGNPARGRVAIHNHGCDACHTIPGILTATATVGPPLTQVAVRTYLAGRIENTPENLMQWIKHPRSIDDKTAMPDTGVNDQDGRDIAAYLYTLR